MTVLFVPSSLHSGPPESRLAKIAFSLHFGCRVPALILFQWRAQFYSGRARISYARLKRFYKEICLECDLVEGEHVEGRPRSRWRQSASSRAFSYDFVACSRPEFVREMVTLPRCTRGNVTNSHRNALKEVLRSHFFLRSRFLKRLQGFLNKICLESDLVEGEHVEGVRSANGANQRHHGRRRELFQLFLRQPPCKSQHYKSTLLR